MKRTCGSCHAEAGSGQFCQSCGIRQVCESCHTPFTSHEKFCGRCGVKRESGGQKVAVPAYEGNRKQSFNLKNVPWLIWVIVGIAALFLFVNKSDNSEEPEKVIEKFFSAIERKDYREAEKYVDLKSPYLEDFFTIEDVSSMPDGLSIKIINFNERDIEEEWAYLIVLADFSYEDESFTEEIDVEFIRKGKRWLIYDLY